MWRVIENVINRFKDRAVEHKPEARFRGDPISKQTYKEVKRSLESLGIDRHFYTVRDVARHHNIGRSTAYRIKAASSWDDFNASH